MSSKGVIQGGGCKRLKSQGSLSVEAGQERKKKERGNIVSSFVVGVRGKRKNEERKRGGKWEGDDGYSKRKGIRGL